MVQEKYFITSLSLPKLIYFAGSVWVKRELQEGKYKLLVIKNCHVGLPHQIRISKIHKYGMYQETSSFIYTFTKNPDTNVIVRGK